MSRASVGQVAGSLLLFSVIAAVSVGASFYVHRYVIGCGGNCCQCRRDRTCKLPCCDMPTAFNCEPSSN